MARYPGSQWVPIAGSPGGTVLPGPFQVVLHKTQGSSAAGAFGAYRSRRSAPTFTIDADTVYQHLDTLAMAYSLANKSGGPQTNRNGPTVQIEIVGFSGTNDLAAVRNAKKVLDWLHKVHGVPLVWPAGAPLHSTQPHRRDDRIWRTKSGLFGHSQVPENDHWDPSFTAAEWDIIGTASRRAGLNIGGLFVADLTKKELAAWLKDGRRENQAVIREEAARTRKVIWSAASRLVNVAEALAGKRIAGRDEWRSDPPPQVES